MTGSLRLLSLLAALLIVPMFGCGTAPPPVYPVHGKVSLDGKPLGEGEVYFKTIETGVLERFEVKNGEFSGLAQPGDRRVEVYAFKVRKGDFGGMKGEVQENLVAPQYSTESKLHAMVTPEGPNEYTFDVKRK